MSRDTETEIVNSFEITAPNWRLFRFVEMFEFDLSNDQNVIYLKDNMSFK